MLRSSLRYLSSPPKILHFVGQSYESSNWHPREQYHCQSPSPPLRRTLAFEWPGEQQPRRDRGALLHFLSWASVPMPSPTTPFSNLIFELPPTTYSLLSSAVTLLEALDGRPFGPASLSLPSLLSLLLLLRRALFLIFKSLLCLSPSSLTYASKTSMFYHSWAPRYLLLRHIVPTGCLHVNSYTCVLQTATFLASIIMIPH